MEQQRVSIWAIYDSSGGIYAYWEICVWFECPTWRSQEQKLEETKDNFDARSWR